MGKPDIRLVSKEAPNKESIILHSTVTDINYIVVPNPETIKNGLDGYTVDKQKDFALIISTVKDCYPAQLIHAIDHFLQHDNKQFGTTKTTLKVPEQG